MAFKLHFTPTYSKTDIVSIFFWSHRDSVSGYMKTIWFYKKYEKSSMLSKCPLFNAFVPFSYITAILIDISIIHNKALYQPVYSEQMNFIFEIKTPSLVIFFFISHNRKILNYSHIRLS